MKTETHWKEYLV